MLVVSKYHQQDKIIPLLENGHRYFGENMVQEALSKWLELKKKYTDIKLHMIGHLQRKKVKDALKIFDVIETLDSQKLAIEIKKYLPTNTKHQFYIQVNIGKESQKYGIKPDEMIDFVDFCLMELQLNITGFMCIPPKDENPSPYFAYLKHLSQKTKINYLSQGMSSDFEEAIAIGTNEIRIGTAILGERIT